MGQVDTRLIEWIHVWLSEEAWLIDWVFVWPWFDQGPSVDTCLTKYIWPSGESCLSSTYLQDGWFSVIYIIHSTQHTDLTQSLDLYGLYSPQQIYNALP